jgi:hypothetical protein
VKPHHQKSKSNKAIVEPVTHATNNPHREGKTHMAISPNKSAPPQVDVKIVVVKGDHANYFVKPLKVEANSKVVWHCGINNFVLWFPKDNNPIANGHTEIHGKNGKASAVVGSKKGVYQYSALVTDEGGNVHLVEGNSPPEMVIC